jgi:hypothetical protein
MALAAVVGVGVGLAVRVRVASLLAAVAWVAGTFLVADLDQVERLRLSWQWLSPYLAPTATRSAIVGLQPDVGWVRLGWLAGLTAVLAAGLLLVVGGRGRRPARGPAAVLVVAVLAIAVSAGALLRAPDGVWFQGPGPGDFAAVDPVTQLPGLYLNADGVVVRTLPGAPDSDHPAVYPDDGLATTCAATAHMRVCVHPSFGRRAAERVAALVEPVAARAKGLPGVPHLARTVPSTALGPTCQDGQVLLNESTVREGLDTSEVAADYADCVVGQYDFETAGEAVWLWLLGPEAVYRAEQGSPMLAAAEAMDKLPREGVVAELRRDWPRIQAGTLPLSELPGGHR